METTHIEYLLSDTEKFLATKGDEMLLNNIHKLLKNQSIDRLKSFAYDIFQYSAQELDEGTYYDDYITIFRCNDVLHFNGEIISKEFWVKEVQLIEDRLANLGEVFKLTESDLIDESAPKIDISIRCKDQQDYNDIYTINLIECGVILIFDWSDFNTKEQCYFSPKLVANVIDYLKQINYLSLKSTYVEDSISDDLNDIKGSNIKRFTIDVTVGDKFKKVCNYNDYNSILTELEKYVEDLVFNKLRKYTRKPERCDICDSININDFSYSKPISEVIVESENNNCHEKCHCVAKYRPAWVCQDCETIYFRE